MEDRNIIMLPNENGVISKCLKGYTEETHWNTNQLIFDIGGHIDWWERQHLYVTSNEEIKVGCWYIFDGYISNIKSTELAYCESEGDGTFTFKHSNGEKLYKELPESGKKKYSEIVATTDLELTKCDGCKRAKDSDTIYTCSCACNIASIPNLIIQAYCDAYKNPIQTVKVEMTSSVMWKEDDGTEIYDWDNIHKINEDGTMAIKLNEPMSPEEAVLAYREYAWKNGVTLKDCNQWINENL